MRGNEAIFWRYLSSVMKGFWEVQRHEDKHSVGIPDLSFTINRHGWMELKAVSPLKDKVHIPHFSEQQKNWMFRFGRRGGGVWLFVKLVSAKPRYCLIDWQTAQDLGTSLEWIEKHSMRVWCGKISPHELAEVLDT